MGLGAKNKETQLNFKAAYPAVFRI